MYRLCHIRCILSPFILLIQKYGNSYFITYTNPKILKQQLSLLSISLFKITKNPNSFIVNNNNKIQQSQPISKKMQSWLQTPRKKYFLILIFLQILIIICQIVGGQFGSGLGSTIFRIVMLFVANYCIDMNFAIFYALFALYNALYLIDPIGLFVTGHSKKSGLQNVMCILAFVLICVASYVGYLYSKELHNERQDPSFNQGGYQNFQNEPSFRPAPINQPQQRPTQPSTSYGGTNYLYQNPTSNSNVRTSNTNNNQFQPFTGHGYSLS